MKSRTLGWLRGAALDVGPLRRHRDFRLLFFSQQVSLFGSMITQVAVAFQVYSITRSTLAVGLLGAVEVVPLLGFGALGGAVADARDRRAIVLVSEAVFAAMSVLLMVNATLPHPLLAALYVVAAIQGAVYALHRPSLDALMPRLVPPEDIVAAGAITSLRGTVGLIGGPAIGGVLLSVTGLPVTYAVDVATFAVSLTLLAAMRPVPAHPEAEPPSLKRIAEGFRYASSRPELVGTYVVDIVAMVFGMPTALFPAIATRLGGPAVLGLLYSAPAVGSALVTATSGWTRRVRRHGVGVLIGATAWGLAIIGFGLTEATVPALAMLAVAGGGDTVSGIFRQAVWNQTIPDRLRGRLAGIEMLSYTSGPALGDLEAGGVASIFGVQASVVSGGVLCVVGVGAMAIILPAFRRYRAAQPPAT